MAQRRVDKGDELGNSQYLLPLALELVNIITALTEKCQFRRCKACDASLFLMFFSVCTCSIFGFSICINFLLLLLILQANTKGLIVSLFSQ